MYVYLKFKIVLLILYMCEKIFNFYSKHKSIKTERKNVSFYIFFIF